MPDFDFEKDGQRYRVTADDEAAALEKLRGATMPQVRGYSGTMRQKTADVLGADVVNHPFWTRVIQGVLGSQGGASAHTPSLVDMTPIGWVMMGQEGTRRREDILERQKTGSNTWGDYFEAFMDPIQTTGAKLPQETVFPATGGGLGLMGEKGATHVAARRVAEAAQKDTAADFNRLRTVTSGVVRPKEAKNIPVSELQTDFAMRQGIGAPNKQEALLVDTGAHTRSLLEDAANKSPAAFENASRTLGARFEGQGERVVDWFRRTFNDPTAALRRLDDAKVAAKSPTSTLYQAAYTRSQNYRIPRTHAPGGTQVITTFVGIEDPVLVNMFGSNHMRSEFGDLLAAAEARMNTKTLAGTSAGIPMRNAVGERTLAYWDQVKRILDDRIGEVKRGSELYRDLTAFREQLIGHLDRHVPEYAQARGVAATMFRAGDAFEAGQNVFHDRSITAYQIEKLLRDPKMGAQERGIFMQGYLHDYLQMLQSVPDRRNILPRLLASPHERAKMDIIVGPSRAAELEGVLNVEAAMDLARGVTGNSATARRAIRATAPTNLRDISLGAAASGLATVATGDPKMLLTGLLLWGASAAERRQAERVAEKVAEMLLSPNSKVYYQGIKAIQRASGDQRPFIDNLRSFIKSRVVAMGGTAAQDINEYFNAGPEGHDPLHPRDTAADRVLRAGQWYRTPQGPQQVR